MLLLIFFITVFYIDKFKTNTPKTHTRKACRTRFEEFTVKCVVHSNYNNLEIRPILGKPSSGVLNLPVEARATRWLNLEIYEHCFYFEEKIAFMHDHSHEPPHPDCMAFLGKILYQKNDVIYFTICRFAVVKHVSLLCCRMCFC